MTFRERWWLCVGFLIGFFVGWALLSTLDVAYALEGPCRDLSVEQTITCAAKRWPVPGGPAKARSVAWCESRYNPKATNGRYRGVFQIGFDTEWPLWLGKFPTMAESWVSGILHGRSNVLVAIRNVHRMGSWHPWSCA